ncbi:MAG TPA: protein-(glutamine-N5) methyltransferase, release factor-specific [Clostridiales bacterium]|nr:MAG: hypothetical protein A2Y18_02340 [Clostridiales bacterium GWD2_32_19]HCC07536.1 protein-(glutamine-N5) methyltransferase, release factor-specific [Clostridiales bacterium]
MPKIMDILKQGKEKLKDSGINTSSLDAELIMSYVTHESRERILARLVCNIADTDIDNYFNLIDKRAGGYPLQYITNHQEFMSLDFYVDERVLIPRPDTEILVENVIKYCKNNKNVVLLDMCTGSGCIAVTLAKYIENISVVAVDISREALDVAKRNAENNSVADKITFIQSNLFENLDKRYINSFDIIVSNPPYIESSIIPALLREVKDFEPKIALDGGETGVDFYKIISKKSIEYFKRNGRLFYEIGYNQGNNVKNILLDFGFDNINIIKDLAEKDRVVTSIYNLK